MSRILVDLTDDDDNVIRFIIGDETSSLEQSTKGEREELSRTERLSHREETQHKEAPRSTIVSIPLSVVKTYLDSRKRRLKVEKVLGKRDRKAPQRYADSMYLNEYVSEHEFVQLMKEQEGVECIDGFFIEEFETIPDKVGRSPWATPHMIAVT